MMTSPSALRDSSRSRQRRRNSDAVIWIMGGILQHPAGKWGPALRFLFLIPCLYDAVMRVPTVLSFVILMTTFCGCTAITDFQLRHFRNDDLLRGYHYA